MEQSIAVKTAERLEKEFDGLIFLDDVPNKEPFCTDQFRTRAVSAMVARYLTGCTAGEAAAYVVDGADDHDIDAVAYSEQENHLWLIQSKWSNKGQAKFGLDDIKKFLYGLDLVLTDQHSQFNYRYQRHANAISDILDGEPKLTVVFALARPADTRMPKGLHPDHYEVLDQALRDGFNRYHKDPAQIEVLTLEALNEIAKAGMKEPPIDLDVVFNRLEVEETDNTVYFGTVTVSEIASWYRQHKERLFQRNIRGGLGRTTVNQKILRTFSQEPGQILARNNGITVVASGGEIGRHGRGKLRGVSIVNGAQTVWASAQAMEDDPQQAAKAKILVKIAMVDDGDNETVRNITEATNTQNQVKVRDLASLHEKQQQLQTEFSEELGLEYVTKYSESGPTETEGCTSEEALIALACCHPDPKYAAQAKAYPDLLWDRSGSGPYWQLFRDDITAVEVWKRVQLAREVDRQRLKFIKKLKNRGERIAQHGDLLLVHIVADQFRHELDDNATVWDDADLTAISKAVKPSAHRMINTTEDLLGSPPIDKTFKHEERCVEIALEIRRSIEAGTQAPAPKREHLRSEDRSERKGNVVPRIVKHGAIEEGTQLEFRPMTDEQRSHFNRWLNTDPRRPRATWVAHGTNCLRWEVDGNTYSATGLAKKLVKELCGKERSVRGPDYWHILNRGSITTIGEKLLADLED